MNFLKKQLIVFSSLAIFCSTIYVYGCADGWWGKDYQSMFSPEAFVDKSYTPFFYDNENLFYGNEYLYSYVSKYNDDVVEDWAQYIGNSEDKKAIAYYLLNDSAAQYIEDILSNKPLKGAKYSLNKKNPKTKEFLEFLQIAKKVEQYSTNTYDEWDYSNKVLDKANANIISSIEDHYNKDKKRSKFFKNRVWFQLMKAKFYSENVDDAISFFEATSADQPKNILYYRALGYVAGANYQKRNFDKSNILFAEIFNYFPRLRHQALYNFHPVDKEAFQNQVNAASSKEIKTALWAINGYYGDEFEAMQEIYKLDPKSEHINFLLTRWVNIQEEAINIYREKAITIPANYQQEVAKAINQSQFDWVREVTSKPELLHNPELWYLATGYLNVFQGNYKEAENDFAQASKLNSTDNKLVENQIRLLNLINSVSQVKEISPKIEAKLGDDLTWLFTDTSLDQDDLFRSGYAKTWITKYLSAVYKNTKNPLMAEVLYADKTFFDDEGNGNAMEELFLKKNKTAWEELFVSLYPYNISDIYECRAINLYYAGKLDEAIAMFQKIKPIPLKTYNHKTDKYEIQMVDYKDNELYGNPFNGKIEDCNDCDHQAKQTVKYSSLSMLQRMKEMKTNIGKGKDVYNNALLIGNAYYNTSYFGNARSFYYNPIFGESGSNYISKDNQSKLYDLKQAKKYYEIALKSARDREQRAKITYMLAKVERNNFYYDRYFSQEDYWGYDPEKIMVKKWDGFNSLKTNYSDTKYYQEVINECGYFRTYLGMK